MPNETVSLLFSRPDSRGQADSRLAAGCVADLGIEQLARALAREGASAGSVLSVLSSPLTDPDEIRYRQEILRDLAASPGLEQGLHDIRPLLEELSRFRSLRRDQQSPFLQAVWRLSELDDYVECIRRLGGILSDRSIGSDGLAALRRFIEAEREQPVFRNLEEELPRLKAGISRRRSVTIGVNLDARLRPVEAALLSVNDRAFGGTTLLGRLFGSGETHNGFVSMTPLHRNPVPDGLAPGRAEKLPLAPLFQDLDILLKSLARPMISVVDRFFRIRTEFLSSLVPEIAFFLGAAALMREIREAGLPAGFPRIVPMRERTAQIRDFFNIHLFLKARGGSGASRSSAAKDIVLNDFSFGAEGRIHILTGPNQGGKTTFTQGVGLLQLLAQVGLFVPAADAEISPADLLATHFPVEEQTADGEGRLSEESARLADIFGRITANSLVLLNESLASTSPAESMVLATDVVRALGAVGVRGIFATHLHDLAARAEELSGEEGSRSRIASLVALSEPAPGNGRGEPKAVRTFRIRPGPPMGMSYARDIARRHGISYEQLMTLLRERSVM